MVFYISSRGHSATTWLARTLMSSGGVICFHGTRTLAGFDSGVVRDTAVDVYLNSLAQMERNTGQVFGSIHGFYGTSARGATLNEGGTFLAVLREPVSRISSIFEANCAPLQTLAVRVGCDPDCVAPDSPMSNELLAAATDELIALQQRETHGHEFRGPAQRIMRSTLRVSSRIRLTSNRPKGDLGIQDLGASIAALFFGAVRDTFLYDAESVRECDERDVILMELFTSDSEYFRNEVWSRVVQDSTVRVPIPSLSPRLNDHVKDEDRGRNPETRFSSWGAVFQRHFLNVASAYPETVQRYQRVGYFCP